MKEEAANTSAFQEAKPLSRQILLTQELETAVSEIRQLERLMPMLTEVDEKKKKWWKKRLMKVVAHAVELVKGDDREQRPLLRLEKSLKKIEDKCPELKDWHL